MDAIFGAGAGGSLAPASVAVAAPGVRAAPAPTGGDSARISIAWKTAIGAVLVTTLLALLSRWSEGDDSRRHSPRLVHHVRTLVRNAAQWSTASKQDQNALIALLHANYALAYANVAKRALPAREIERVANVNIDEMIDVLEEQQLAAMQRIAQEAPTLQPEGTWAVATGWLA